MELFLRLHNSDLTSKYLVMVTYTLAALCSYTDGSLTIKPVNIEAVIGQRVEFICSTSESYYVLWDHASVGSASRSYVFFSGVLVLPYSQRFQMNRDNVMGRYNLVIPSVQKEDAGNYRCMDKVGHGEQAEAELIVLDSSPQCSTDVIRFCKRTSQEVKLSCTVGFTGNLVPEIECSDSGLSEVTEQTPESVIYRLRLTANWPLDAHPIICRTSISHVSSTVDPTVMYAFESSQSLTMDPHKTVGVDCKANSSEPCSYQWIDEDMVVVTNSQTLTTNEDGQYKCRATCVLRDHVCILIPLVAELSVAAGFSDATTDNDRYNEATTDVAIDVIAGCIAGAVAAAAVLVVVMLCIKHHRKRREYQEATRPVHV